MYKKIKLTDQKIAAAINDELKRQQNCIELIASENYVSEQVLLATGSVLTNKYGEGYPGKRYYDGCEFIDQVENLAIERAKKLFQTKFANVQPMSGTVANMAILGALLNPGDRILGMDLSSGGHLSHGFRISFSGKFFQSFTYEVEEDGKINYEKVLQIAKKVKPRLIICGYSNYSQQVDFVAFRKICDTVNAFMLADISHIAGLIVGKQHPSPAKYADVIMTTTHKTLRGARGAIILWNNPEFSAKINSSVFPGIQGGPLFHSIAGKAVSFWEALQPSFQKYATQVIKNAAAFCRFFLNKNKKIISGETQTHLFTIDTKTSYGLTGKKASEILSQINITVNKNTIPFDSESPSTASGIRLGSAAMTSRGLLENDFLEIAQIIDQALSDFNNQKLLQNLKQKVAKITKKFPIKKSYV